MITQGLGGHGEHFGSEEGCDLIHIVSSFPLIVWGRWSLLGTMVRTFLNPSNYLIRQVTLSSFNR